MAQADVLLYPRPYPTTPCQPSRPALVVCACCERGRDEDGRWLPLRSLVREAASGFVTHGLCMDCASRLYPEVFDS